MILSNLTERASTDPTELVSLRDSIYAADLFIAALAELDFFTWLAENQANQDQICRDLGLATRPVDVMLSLFMAMGLVPQEEDRQLPTKSFATLPPGGQVAIHDAHLNADKTGPMVVAQYSVLLLYSTQGKCYSMAEMEQYLRQMTLPI